MGADNRTPPKIRDRDRGRVPTRRRRRAETMRRMNQMARRPMILIAFLAGILLASAGTATAAKLITGK